MTRENNRSDSLADFPNLGTVSIRMLASAGITTAAQLRDLGPVIAFLAVRQTGAKPSLNLLWAISAGLRGLHWTDLTRDQKDSLLAEMNELTR